MSWTLALSIGAFTVSLLTYITLVGLIKTLRMLLEDLGDKFDPS
jgi:hypothetical protein